MILIVSLVFYLISLGFWEKALKGTIYYGLLDSIVTINIMTVVLFMALGYMNLKFIIILVKSALKILFTVWVVVIVQFSTLDQIEQNVWIILSAFFLVYMEVLLELNDCLHQVNDNFRIPKIKFITAIFIKENSLSISIFFMSIINVFLSYSVINLLEHLKLI